MVPENRRGSLPVTRMHETAALERKAFTSSESNGSGTAEIDCSGSGSRSGSDGRPRDMFHRELIESRIDALRRVSHEPDTSFPSWTVTK
jgi:hypothetical protein